MASFLRQTYGQRIQNHTNPAAKLLLETMERKKSNLAVSVDVTKSKDFLAIIDAVGPFVCLVKANLFPSGHHLLFFSLGTHVDIIEDFDQSLVQQLQDLSIKHDFVIFEDRKFADIGNTVALQYSSGVHKIANWSHITNAHPVPGPSIISGLSSVGLPLGRGLLLLSEMSTKGALAVGSYTQEAVRMARAHRDFVIGFIAQRTMEGIGMQENTVDKDDFLILTPGVGLDAKGDAMGQQYRTPRQVILESGCDVIIVGRGIYGKDPGLVDEIRAQAKRYMEAGWEAYQDRVSAQA
ncbi:orotidine-5'-monophosphate decarboxylase [Lentinula edodes]|nr:orotidine-5'-monophosphate decarboxylase [Lentinula edodes]